MIMKTILLKLSGPLQSWGTSSHFETRHTDPYPSKSAVIGMISAALGYRRDEDEKIAALNDLDYAVRVDQTGSILRDYHTAAQYKKNGDFSRTYVTNRYYLEDYIFSAAIGSEDDGLIDKIEHALEHPYFQIYLGRRSLPVNIDLVIRSENTDVITAINNLEWQAASWYRKRHFSSDVHMLAFADAHLIDNSSYILRNDHVISFSQRHGRKFASRKEAKFYINLQCADVHDAFAAVEEN